MSLDLSKYRADEIQVALDVVAADFDKNEGEHDWQNGRCTRCDLYSSQWGGELCVGWMYVTAWVPVESRAKPKGHTVLCSNCTNTAFLPEVEPGRVSITGLDGWTAPPTLCPQCSPKKTLDTDASGGAESPHA